MNSNYLKPDLQSKIENHMLDHVFRNHLTTRAVLARLFYPEGTLGAVTRRTTSLVERGYLNKHPLFGKQVYFTAGQRSIRRFRLSRRAARPLPRQRLPVELASLMYCCSGEIIRKRLTAPEILARYPWFPKPYLYAHPFHLDYENQVPRLASVRVELSGSPQYIVNKHNKQLYELSNSRRFRQLLERDEFMLVTITTSADRRDALIEEIRNQAWYPTSRVVDYPDLVHFL